MEIQKSTMNKKRANAFESIGPRMYLYIYFLIKNLIDLFDFPIDDGIYLRT